MVSPLAVTKKLIIGLIRAYQIGISPILGRRCRFSITCSQYGINVINKFGILKGIWKICIRILKCHPLSTSNKENTITIFKRVNIKDVVKMNSQGNFIIIIFLIISFMLWYSWDIEHYHNNTKLNYTEQNNNIKSDSQTLSNTYKKHINTKNTNYNNIITIKTDVFSLKINMWGGNIEEAYLIKYLDNINSTKPLYLLNISKECAYQAHSTLKYTFGSDNLSVDNNEQQQLLYTNINPHNNSHEYILEDNQNTLKITLIHRSKDNIVYTKHYIFNRNDYAIRIYHIIHNNSIYSINAKLFGNLTQSMYSTHSLHNDNPTSYTYQEAALSTDKKKYQKYNFTDIKKIDLEINSSGGWIALLQKYFLIAWLPIIPINNTFYTTYTNENSVSIGFKSNPIHIPTGQKYELQSILWIGPKIQEKMKIINPNLNLVIDYSWLWFISQPLFKLLQFIHYYINNWGIAIILITIIIRMAMYPLTKVQYTSMAKIRMLQPKLTTIQELYKHDKYQYHQKTIELYKKEKVNPLGGCLPLLIQMPIFLALYYMLSSSVELRHAKFAFWINDLSEQDPYYILPVIMGITIFFIQKLSPTTITDPVQKKIMNIMLIMFTIFFLWLPSGLVLYYIISNIITIIQQQIIYQGLSKK